MISKSNRCTMSPQTFTQIPGINISLLNKQDKEHLFSLLRQYGIQTIQILPSQKIAVEGIDSQIIHQIVCDLEKKLYINTNAEVTYVHTCPGLDECKYAVANALNLGRRIESLSFPHTFPHKVKISIAGCSMCCTEPYVRDVGIIAMKKGWTVTFGGNAGRKPRIADEIGKNLSENAVVDLVQKALTYYCENCRKKMRTARFIEQIEIDTFKNAILKNT